MGAAIGAGFDNPVTVKGTGVLAETGVDAVAHGLLTFASGFIAEIAVAVCRNMDNRAIITGDKGQIVIDDPWVPGRNAGPSDATLHITVGKETYELPAFSFAIATMMLAIWEAID